MLKWNFGVRMEKYACNLVGRRALGYHIYLISSPESRSFAVTSLVIGQKRARRFAASSGCAHSVRLRGTMPWSQPWYVVRRIVGGSLLYTRTTELSVWGRAFVPCVLMQAPLTVENEPDVAGRLADWLRLAGA